MDLAFRLCVRMQYRGFPTWLHMADMAIPMSTVYHRSGYDTVAFGQVLKVRINKTFYDFKGKIFKINNVNSDVTRGLNFWCRKVFAGVICEASPQWAPHIVLKSETVFCTKNWDPGYFGQVFQNFIKVYHTMQNYCIELLFNLVLRYKLNVIDS